MELFHCCFLTNMPLAITKIVISIEKNQKVSGEETAPYPDPTFTSYTRSSAIAEKLHDAFLQYTMFCQMNVCYFTTLLIHKFWVIRNGAFRQITNSFLLVFCCK